MLGEYLGYTKAFLFSIEQSQSNPLAWILCSACTKAQNIASFIYNLEHYFYNYGHCEAFTDWTTGHSSILSSSYWKSIL